MAIFPNRGLRMRQLRVACEVVALIGVMMLCAVWLKAEQAQGPRFSVTFPRELSAQGLDGRLLLLLSTDPSAEPRMQYQSLGEDPAGVRRGRRRLGSRTGIHDR